MVVLALSIASVTYGALLGTYLLAAKWPRATGRDVIAAVLVTVSLMLVVIFARRLAGHADSPGSSRWDDSHGRGMSPSGQFSRSAPVWWSSYLPRSQRTNSGEYSDSIDRASDATSSIGADVGGSKTAVGVSDGWRRVARADGPGAAVRPGRALASASTITEVVRSALLGKAGWPAISCRRCGRSRPGARAGRAQKGAPRGKHRRPRHRNHGHRDRAGRRVQRGAGDRGERRNRQHRGRPGPQRPAAPDRWLRLADG